ncbi:hypothetical protein niasHT_007086 [Heterodera trifolii]|uniref:Resolvase/invertase-type recombinase catalytic domain-containing protein n=1 Tax=Heterodera trifolii TaxID=157864 RepID=A0ABD2LXJ7_9BILA
MERKRRKEKQREGGGKKRKNGGRKISRTNRRGGGRMKKEGRRTDLDWRRRKKEGTAKEAELYHQNQKTRDDIFKFNVSANNGEGGNGKNWGGGNGENVKRRKMEEEGTEDEVEENATSEEGKYGDEMMRSSELTQKAKNRKKMRF